MSQSLNARFVILLSFICALTVGNLYIAQPLLEAIANDFHRSPAAVGWVTTLAQLGYGLGVLLIVPLGDVSERKKLMLSLLAFVGVSSLAASWAPSLLALSLASLAIGFATVVPQIIMPYAAALADPDRRASVLGTIQGGLLIGILVARTVSGFIASMTGWRSVYVVAALAGLAVFVVVRFRFPRQEPASRFTYHQLLMSLLTLLRQHSRLRRVSISGAMNFAVFSMFWTVLAFLLNSSFGLGPASAGLFGLVGVVGALIAGVSGRIVDRKGARFVQLSSLAITLVSYLIYAFSAHSLWALIVGVIVMDIGVQANHISCQADVFTLDLAAQSRLNGLYMFIRFGGGALGSFIGAWSWNQFGWSGVVAAGLLLSLMSFVPLVAQSKLAR